MWLGRSIEIPTNWLGFRRKTMISMKKDLPVGRTGPRTLAKAGTSIVPSANTWHLLPLHCRTSPWRSPSNAPAGIRMSLYVSEHTEKRITKFNFNICEEASFKNETQHTTHQAKKYSSSVRLALSTWISKIRCRFCRAWKRFMMPRHANQDEHSRQ